jgi:cyclopropane-fatty-acyl-phospholipid synthase
MPNSSRASLMNEHRPPTAPYRGDVAALATLLARADVRLDGPRPWDLQLHRPRAAHRILAGGNLGLGESYMDGDWDCERLDELIHRLLRARLDRSVRSPQLLWAALRARLFNLQSEARAFMVGRQHYDLGNDFFAAMLDPSMTYSCGYWAEASTLAEAQKAKLDLICRKLELKPGMRLLDIGCGWGSLLHHAAHHYGVQGVGLTVSEAQAAHGRQRCSGLPVQIELSDYRHYQVTPAQRFDRIASVGMFEHVGHKNYPVWFERVRRCLRDDGLLLLHTIGKRENRGATDPWIDRYIFPNGELPLLDDLVGCANRHFVVEDVHNFGADYDPTLMAWHQNVHQAWPRFADRYGERFRRMWRYYLLSCAGAFRARMLQLWQVVLSPNGVAGGYRRPS